MPVVHPVCCGIDVHQARLTACLRCVASDSQVTQEVREFATTYSASLAFTEGLIEQHCPVVAMESTGVYWQPVSHVLSGALEVVVGKAQEMRRRPGRKTDQADARWIAELLAHGLIRPSLLPPPPIQARRDLTRTRVALVQSRSQAKNRVPKILEETTIKLASVVADLFGVSGRRMLAALIAGERDSHVLATFARGRLRRKRAALELALQGQFTAHHGRLMALALEVIDLMNRQIAELDQQIGELMTPLYPQIEQLISIPGVEATSARMILAEIGIDMSRFGSDARLASWAGGCPSHDESAGKRRRGHTRHGNRYLRRVLVQCAWAARKTSTFLGRTFRRLEARLGGKKAAMAVAQTILVMVYHLLAEGTLYDEERYNRLSPQQEERQRRRAVQALQALGYRVTLELVG
jgi:transposase